MCSHNYGSSAELFCYTYCNVEHVRAAIFNYVLSVCETVAEFVTIGMRKKK